MTKKIIIGLLLISNALMSCNKEDNLQATSSANNSKQQIQALQKGVLPARDRIVARRRRSSRISVVNIPPVVVANVGLTIDETKFKPKDYEDITNVTAQLSVEESPIKEFSGVKGSTIDLEMRSFDPKTGEVKLKSKALSFSYLLPEFSYKTKMTVTLTYTRKEEKEKKSGVIIPAKTEEETYDLGIDDMDFKRNGNPYTVTIKSPKTGKTSSFLMYASSPKEIQSYFYAMEEFKNDKLLETVGITLIEDKIPDGLEEIIPYFNVDNYHLVSLETPSNIIGVGNNPLKAWTFDPTWETDGKGTKATTSSTKTKPFLF